MCELASLSAASSHHSETPRETRVFFKNRKTITNTNITCTQLHWFTIYLLILDLQQVQHHSMGSHVFQQALLLHPALLTLIAQLCEPLQDLKKRLNHSLTSFFFHWEKK